MKKKTLRIVSVFVNFQILSASLKVLESYARFKKAWRKLVYSTNNKVVSDRDLIYNYTKPKQTGHLPNLTGTKVQYNEQNLIETQPHQTSTNITFPITTFIKP